MMKQITYNPYLSKTEAKSLLPKLKITPISFDKEEETQVVISPLPSTQKDDNTEVKDDKLIDWNDKSRAGKSKNAKQYLMDALGLKAHQAAALVGVFLSESGLNENAENKWEKGGGNSNVKSNQYGIGINQWTHDRHDNFVNWTNTHGKSLQSQLDFAANEIKTKYPEFLTALRQADTVDEATGYTYSMYTGANHRNVNKDNWKKFVSKTESPYLSLARSQGWNPANVGFNRRLQFANEALSYKQGGVIKAQEGVLLENVRLAEQKPKPYQPQYSFNSDEYQFQKWYRNVAQSNGLSPNSDDPEHHYDWRGYFKEHNNSVEVIPKHFPDKYKLLGHETFSVESKYYKPGMMAGHWEGDVFVPTPFSEEDMLIRQHWAESRFKPDQTSEKGAQGHFQIMPKVWNDIVSRHKLIGYNTNNYEDNKRVRDIHMKELSDYPSIKIASEPIRTALTYAAYNWGPGKVANFIKDEAEKGIDVYSNWDWIDDLPADVKRYVNFIVRGIDASADWTTEALNKALLNDQIWYQK